MNKVIAAVLLGGSIFLSNLVLAEDLTVYLKETTIKKFDLGEKGDSVPDLITRSGNLFFKLDGPAVGVVSPVNPTFLKCCFLPVLDSL